MSFIGTIVQFVTTHLEQLFFVIVIVSLRKERKMEIIEFLNREKASCLQFCYLPMLSII